MQTGREHVVRGAPAPARPRTRLAVVTPRDPSPPAGFAGFTQDAFDFYEDLEADNSKGFWEAHKERYLGSVRRPMEALAAALEPEFGAAKVYRPHRDVRFSADKTPYKTHQGAHVPTGPACGWYTEVGAPGMRLGGGFYRASPANLARVRARIDDERHGARLAAIIAGLVAAGWSVQGETVRTAPRGYPRDHPRIDLLRHKSLYVARPLPDDVACSPGVVAAVAAGWRETTPLLDWLRDPLWPEEDGRR